MADEAPKTPEVPPVSPSAQPDEFKNFKAEMGRKLGNLEQTNAELLATLKSLTAKPAPSSPEKKVSVFEDEEAYGQRIAAEAEARIEKKLAAQNAQTQKQQAVLASLVAEFPELNQADSDLAKRAVEIYNGLPEDERTSPMSYKVAVKDAALELGVKPKSKRNKGGDDDFTLSSSKSAGRPPKKGEVDPVIEDLASAFGVKLDAAAKERIVNRHGRKTYSSWE